MPEFMHDAHAWVAFSFVIFAAVAFMLGRRQVLAALDGHIAKVRHDIDTAAALRAEAQKLFDDYSNQHKDSAAESAKIIANAQTHAAEIRAQAQRELSEALERREQQLTQRLCRMEDAAVQDIKAYAADLVVKATAEIIADKMDEKTGLKLIDQSVNQLSGQLNAG